MIVLNKIRRCAPISSKMHPCGKLTILNIEVGLAFHLIPPCSRSQSQTCRKKPDSFLIFVPGTPVITGKPGATAATGSTGTPDKSGRSWGAMESAEAAAAGAWVGSTVGVTHVAAAAAAEGFRRWGGCGGGLYWWCCCCCCCCCWRCCSRWWWWERMGIVGTGGIIPPATGRTGTAWGLRAKAAAG